MRKPYERSEEQFHTLERAQDSIQLVSILFGEAQRPSTFTPQMMASLLDQGQRHPRRQAERQSTDRPVPPPRCTAERAAPNTRQRIAYCTSRPTGANLSPVEPFGTGAGDDRQSRPLQDEYLAPLWAALDDLDSKGVAYNHSKTPESLLALNWGLLREQLDLHCPGVKPTIDIRRRAQESTEPKYLLYKCVDSAIKNKSVKCHVFEAREST